LFGLQHKKVGHGWWGIKPENAGLESGLIIESDYPELVKFTTLR
jgi:hypothetical protein